MMRHDALSQHLGPPLGGGAGGACGAACAPDEPFWSSSKQGHVTSAGQRHQLQQRLRLLNERLASVSAGPAAASGQDGRGASGDAAAGSGKSGATLGGGSAAVHAPGVLVLGAARPAAPPAAQGRLASDGSSRLGAAGAPDKKRKRSLAASEGARHTGPDGTRCECTAGRGPGGAHGRGDDAGSKKKAKGVGCGDAGKGGSRGPRAPAGPPAGQGAGLTGALAVLGVHEEQPSVERVVAELKRWPSPIRKLENAQRVLDLLAFLDAWRLEELVRVGLLVVLASWVTAAADSWTEFSTAGSSTFDRLYVDFVAHVLKVRCYAALRLCACSSSVGVRSSFVSSLTCACGGLVCPILASGADLLPKMEPMQLMDLIPFDRIGQVELYQSGSRGACVCSVRGSHALERILSRPEHDCTVLARAPLLPPPVSLPLVTMSEQRFPDDSRNGCCRNFPQARRPHSEGRPGARHAPHRQKTAQEEGEGASRALQDFVER